MISPISQSEQMYTDFSGEELNLCLCNVNDVHLRSVKQSPVIANLKGNGFSFFAVRTTEIQEQAVNCLHILCK